MLEDLFGCTDFHEFALVKESNPISNLACKGHLVCGHDDGVTRAFELAHKIQNFAD